MITLRPSPSTPRGWFGTWPFARASGAGLRVLVAGNEAGPQAEHLASLVALVERFDVVAERIEAFVAGLGGEVRVPLQGRHDSHFAASDCGFRGGWFRYVTVSVTGEASEASVTLYTGQPDGYANFEVTLRHGEPVAITAFCS